MFGGKKCEGSDTEEVIGCIDVCPGKIKAMKINFQYGLKNLKLFLTTP